MKKIILLGFAAMVLLACSRKNDSESGGGGDDPGTIIPELPFDQLPATQASFNVAGQTTYVNVMENNRKSLPTFPALKKIANKAIGYVKDSYGRPLKNASIGISSSIVGGGSTPAFGVTNEKGYYEISIPFGEAYYYNAGYTIDYEGSRGAMGLYPADGEMSASFASANGEVKNFVLLPYGKGAPDEVASDPWDPNNYFGGSLTLSWMLRDGSLPPEGSLPIGMVFEVKLTPLALVHAAEKKTITIRKTVEFTTLRIVNIPLGKYKVEIHTSNGTAMKMQQTGINRRPEYGLNPTSATGSATYTMIPTSADSKRVTPFRGAWDEVGITIKL